jgi:TPR repeat protein
MQISKSQNEKIVKYLVYLLNESDVNCSYLEQRIQAQPYYFKAANKGYKEGNWRIAALFNNIFGIQKNSKQMKAHSKKGLLKNSIDGFFWFGQTFSEYEDCFDYFMKASLLGHSTSRFCLGRCLFYCDEP